jgi:uncharacterized lipoprotein YmbA
MKMRWIVIAIAMLLASCSFLKPSKSSIYSLERIAPAAAVTGERVVPPVALDGIELPPGLDRKEIAVRKADHQWDVRGTEQWSTTLEQQVLHTLAFDLAGRLSEGTMILPGATRPAGVVRSVSVVFEEFAAGPENAFVLDARWTVAESAHHERITVEMASLDSAEVASAASKALAMLADRIAPQL